MSCKNSKEPWQRISVSLPPLMMTDLKAKSQLTGLSISRIVYLRLREHGDIVIVPDSIREELQRLQRLLIAAQNGSNISAETLECLREHTALVKSVLDKGGEEHA